MNLLVVTGSRVWDVDRRSARRARAQVARALLGYVKHLRDPGAPADIVTHGDAAGPDTYADEFAEVMLLPRVVFGLRGDGRPVLRDRSARQRNVTFARLLRDADNWRFVLTPLERNAALVAWAVTQERSGHHVRVVGLVAPWAPTKGTCHTLGLAARSGLRVETIDGTDVPSDAWPKDVPVGEEHGA